MIWSHDLQPIDETDRLPAFTSTGAVTDYSCLQCLITQACPASVPGDSPGTGTRFLDQGFLGIWDHTLVVFHCTANTARLVTIFLDWAVFSNAHHQRQELRFFLVKNRSYFFYLMKRFLFHLDFDSKALTFSSSLKTLTVVNINTSSIWVDVLIELVHICISSQLPFNLSLFFTAQCIG